MGAGAFKGGACALAYYCGDRKTGSISMVDLANGAATVTRLATGPASGLDAALKPVFVGLAEDRRVIVLDPRTKRLSIQPEFPADAFPAHIYSDPRSSRDWFMNDGDKENGNDTLNCGDRGASVMVIENTGSAAARYLATICVGRGHHQATFSFPSERAPDVPYRAYVSNLKDGTLSVLGNDPADAANYLRVVATINLCESDREEGRAGTVPNRAFPHGLVYSPYNGRIYNLNNGYGTVAIIDPRRNVIERRVDLPGHSNLFVTPDGRYVIARGADRKTDSEHVIGKLTVLDVATAEVVGRLDLADIYISKYYFNAAGTKLYLTAGCSGSPRQQENCKQNVLVVLDAARFPQLRVLKEIEISASSGALAFVSGPGGAETIFSSNSADGSLAVIDGASDSVVDSIAVAPGATHTRVWAVRG